MFCIKCGSQLDDEALFCANCGAKIKSRASENAPSNSENVVNKPNSNKPTIQYFITESSKLSKDQKVRIALIVLTACLIIFNFLPCATVVIGEKRYYSYLKFLITEGISFNYLGDHFDISWFGKFSMTAYKYIAFLLLAAEIAQIAYLVINRSLTVKVKKEIRKYRYIDLALAIATGLLSWFIPAVVEHQCYERFEKVTDYGMGLSNVYMEIHYIFFIPLIIALVISYIVKLYIPKRTVEDVIDALNSGMCSEAIEYYKDGEFAQSGLKIKNEIFLAVVNAAKQVTFQFRDNNISYEEAAQKLNTLNEFDLAPEEVKDATTLVNNTHNIRIKQNNASS